MLGAGRRRDWSGGQSVRDPRSDCGAEGARTVLPGGPTRAGQQGAPWVGQALVGCGRRGRRGRRLWKFSNRTPPPPCELPTPTNPFLPHQVRLGRTPSQSMNGPPAGGRRRDWAGGQSVCVSRSDCGAEGARTVLPGGPSRAGRPAPQSGLRGVAKQGPSMQEGATERALSTPIERRC